MRQIFKHYRANTEDLPFGSLRFCRGRLWNLYAFAGLLLGGVALLNLNIFIWNNWILWYSGVALLAINFILSFAIRRYCLVFDRDKKQFVKVNRDLFFAHKVKYPANEVLFIETSEEYESRWIVNKLRLHLKDGKEIQVALHEDEEEVQQIMKYLRLFLDFSFPDTQAQPAQVA